MYGYAFGSDMSLATSMIMTSRPQLFLEVLVSTLSHSTMFAIILH